MKKNILEAAQAGANNPRASDTMEQEVIDEIIQARGRKNLESQLISKFTSKKFLKEKLQTVSAATRVVDTLDFVADAKSAVHVLYVSHLGTTNNRPHS